MAAGFPKTFEIGRAYRNEGTSPEHLQEFTNMEFYWAYANYKDGMKLSQEMYGKEVTALFKKTKEIFDPQNIFNPGKKVGDTTGYMKAHHEKSIH
jgi:lysyl-tRNA synthetase class 2